MKTLNVYRHFIATQFDITYKYHTGNLIPSMLLEKDSCCTTSTLLGATLVATENSIVITLSCTWSYFQQSLRLNERMKTSTQCSRTEIASERHALLLTQSGCTVGQCDVDMLLALHWNKPSSPHRSRSTYDITTSPRVLGSSPCTRLHSQAIDYLRKSSKAHIFTLTQVMMSSGQGPPGNPHASIEHLKKMNESIEIGSLIP